jgi:uncharacterized membrane protein
MSASKVLLVCWLVLTVLCVSTILLGNAGPTPLLTLAVLLVAVSKAWLIADSFMELRHASRLWRGLMLSWPLVMAAGILLTLLIFIPD